MARFDIIYIVQNVCVVNRQLRDSSVLGVFVGGPLPGNFFFQILSIILTLNVGISTSDHMPINMPEQIIMPQNKPYAFLFDVIFCYIILVNACILFIFVCFCFHHWCTYIFFILILVYYASIINNCIGGVIVSGLASSVVDRGFEPRSGQTKLIKLVSAVSPLSTQH